MKPKPSPSRRVIVGLAALGAAGLAARSVWTPEQVMDGKSEPSPSPDPSGRLPTLYIPHGGGPCFFMEWTMGPPDTWDRMAAYLREVGQRYTRPKALLVVSAHWEEPVVTVQSGAAPPLLFDYYGFPPETYQLTWPAQGAPAVAARVRALLDTAGIPNTEDAARGFDHGVFIPLKLAYPAADIPTLQLSLNRTLDPRSHLALGRALAPLRDEGVLIVGSGMSFHNLRTMLGGAGSSASLGPSQEFDGWLAEVCAGPPAERDAHLEGWSRAPSGRYCHPREEHLLPLMVVAGAAQAERGRRVFTDAVLGAQVSAFEFGLARA